MDGPQQDETSVSKSTCQGEAPRAQLSDQEFSRWLEIVETKAHELWNQSELSELEDLYHDILEATRERLGGSHLATLFTQRDIAHLHHRQGRFQEAEIRFRQILVPMTELLGAEHLDTVNTMQLRGTTLLRLSRHEESEEQFRAAIPILADLFAANDPVILAARFNFATALASQRKFEEASQVWYQALPHLQHVLIGSLGNDPHEVMSLGVSLANELYDGGKFEQSEELCRENLETLKSVFGELDWTTMTTKKALANCLDRKGHHEESEKLHRQVAEALRASVDFRDEVKVVCLDELATNLQQQGKSLEALEVFQESLYLKISGKVDLSSRLSSLFTIAGIIEQQTFHDKALPLFRQALDLSDETFGEQDPGTLLTTWSLSASLVASNKYDEAEVLLRQALPKMRAVFGEDDTVTINSASLLGAICVDTERFSDAVAILEPLVNTLEKTLGPDSPRAIAIKSALAAAFLRWHEEIPLQAPFFYQMVEFSLDQNDPHLALRAKERDLGYQRREMIKRAEEIYRDVLAITESTLGNDHPSIAKTVTGLSIALSEQRKFKELELVLRRVFKASKEACGEYHPQTVGIGMELGKALDKLERYDDAELLHRYSFEARQKILSAESPTAATAQRLCQRCMDAILEPLMCSDSEGGPSKSRAISHHQNMADMFHSAKQCTLCEMIASAASRRDDFRVHELLDFNITPPLASGVDATLAEEAGLHPREVGCSARGSDDIHVLSFVAKMNGPENDLTARAIYDTHLALDLREIKRLELVKSWLTACLKDHQRCTDWQSGHSPQRPTRLIDLGDVESPNPSPSPRLIDTKDLDQADLASYSALSHCWGNATPESGLTTRANEMLYRQGISFDSLPRTYRDAMRATRALGIRYIWIDSLCVLQGDQDDWAAEAETMCDVYKGCTILLASPNAVDANGGCFLVQSNASKTVRYMSDDEERSVEIFITPKRSFSPLDTRGWVLQETLLAPRTVYLAQDQFYWQCQICVHSEDGVVQDGQNYRLTHSASVSRQVNFRSQTVVRDFWNEWVRDYTSRGLSRPSDYMAALAGLTKHVAIESKLIPALGLWADEYLAYDLSWSPRDLGGFFGEEEKNQAAAPKKSVLPNVPSWSWFHFQTPIHYFWVINRIVGGTAVTKLVDWDIRWERTAMTSDIASSRLLVSGPVELLTLYPNRSRKTPVHVHNWDYSRLSCALDEPCASSTDGGQDEDFSITAPCLWLSFQTLNYFGTFLVLEEVPCEGSELKIYRRIGISHFRMHFASLHPFLGVDHTTLELV